MKKPNVHKIPIELPNELPIGHQLEWSDKDMRLVQAILLAVELAYRPEFEAHENMIAALQAENEIISTTIKAGDQRLVDAGRMDAARLIIKRLTFVLLLAALAGFACGVRLGVWLIH